MDQVSVHKTEFWHIDIIMFFLYKNTENKIFLKILRLHIIIK